MWILFSVLIVPDLEKLFKQQDELGSGAVSMQGMKKILKEMMPEFNQGEELTEMMTELARKTKYTKMNSATKKVEVCYRKLQSTNISLT